MLVSVVLNLQALEEATCPLTLGYAIHAAFLDLVRRTEASLAARLHEPRRTQPFTTSPLQGPLQRHADHIHIQAGATYWLRFTSLEPELSHVLLTAPLETFGPVTLSGARFAVCNVWTQAEEHAWAGQTTYEELYNDWVATERRLPRKVQLRFFSPTTFRSNGRNLPFPLPRRVFSALGQKWNAYAPIHLGEEVARVAEEVMSLSAYELRTHILDFGKYRQVGFVGACEFRVQPPQEDIWARVLMLLAEFTFFAGVGYKTPMGMGQVRRVPGAQTRSAGAQGTPVHQMRGSLS